MCISAQIKNKSVWFHQEQNIVAGRAMNKPLQDENSWLSGES
jgi:hypothetical protein